MANRITTLFDLDSKGFDSGLKKLRTEVAKADGAINKLKVAGSGLGSILQANLGAAAIGAGTAIAAFGVKSVQTFQNLALESGKFAEATGIAIEEASRWVDIAGDFQIESGAIQSAMQKMNIAIARNSPALAQLSDEIVRAKDGSVDASATFQNLVTRIGAIKDPTEQALVAQQVFGKGYSQIAEIMGLSARDLAKRLAEVPKANIFSDKQDKQAEKFRQSMEDLKGRVEELQLELGAQLVPVLTDASEALVNIADFGRDVSDVFEDIGGSGLVDFFSPLDNIASGLNKVFGDNVSVMDRFKGGVELVGSAFPGVSEAISDMVGPTEDATKALGRFIEAGTEETASIEEMYRQRLPAAMDTTTTYAEDLKKATDEVAEAHRRANQRARELLETTEELYGIERDAISRRYELRDAMLELNESLGDTNATMDDQFDSAIRTSEAYAKLNGESLNSESGTRRQIESLESLVDTLAPGSPLRVALEEYVRQLRSIPSKVVTQTELRVRGATMTRDGDTFGWRALPGEVIAGADGGIVNRPTMALIGEAGPEAVVPLSKSPGNGPLPTNFGMGSAPMVVNITTGADPEDVVRAIEKFKRRNGSLPF